MMANSSSVRNVIELFCKILSENKVHDSELSVRAETLRQAKFNNPAATSPMWQLLHSGICFCKRKPLQTYTSTSFELTEDVIVSIKSQLQNWGYLDQTFSRLCGSSQDCSRQLLLALGWMWHKKKMFDLIISRRHNPLHETLGSFTNSKPEAALNRGFTEIQNPRNLSLKDQLQAQVLLCGKLHQALKRLYATQQLHTTLTNKIAVCTKGVNLQTDLDHLTALEVLLLKNKQELKKKVSRLEEDNDQLRNLLEWKEKENIFWEWMDSVLSLHIEERTREPQDVDEEDEVYLSVPADIGQDIQSTRAKLRDLILSHEDHIELMEKLVAAKKIPKSDLQWMSLVLEREVAQLSHSLAHCGPGLDTGADSFEMDKEGDQKPHEDAEKSELNVPSMRQPGRVALKNASSLEVQRKVKEKMEEMERTVKDLELDLQNLQAQHLQKLQALVTQDPSIICIQPTTLKHLFRS